ncbi:uncharacterized protein LOC111131734 [Crassostrea virginica]
MSVHGGEEEHVQRDRALSEKGKVYKLELYEQSFKSLKQSVTQIKRLILENKTENREEIRKKYSKWLQNYEHFLLLFEQMVIGCKDQQEKDEVVKSHYDYDVFLMNFKREVEEFFSCQESVKYETQNETKRDARSHKSRSSASSSISFEKLKEEQRIAELETRKASLKKRKELEIAKLELKLKEEELDLDTDIAISNAKSEVLQKFELNSELSDLVESEHGEAEESTPRRFLLKPSPRIASAREEAELGSELSIQERPLNPNAKSFIPKDADAMQSVVQYLRRPIPEIKKFGGNPLEYRRFIRQFHNKVVINTKDDDERLNYLEQMTYGEAYKVVSGYSHMTGDKGYQAAMKQLEERYGDNELIVTSFIKKALEWPTIKDAKMLDEFALFLLECQNASESIDSVCILDYADNIKKLMSKLPVYLHDRWRSVILKIKDSKRRVQFRDFVTFVKTEAKKSNDPIYGVVSLSGIPRTNIDKGHKRTVASVNLIGESESTGMLESVCDYCGSSSHSLKECRRFQEVSLQERYNFMRSKGLCYGCLKKGHMTRKCRNRLKCSTCSRSHPTVLHDPTRLPSNSSNSKKEQNYNNSSTLIIDQPTTSYFKESANVSACCDNGAGDQSCAMAIIPVRIKLKDKSHSIVTYAFFDTGSSVTFCSDNLMRQLGASGKKCNITLNTLGESYQLSSHVVKGLQISNLDMTEFIDLPKVYTKDKMPVNHDHIPTKEEILRWPHLSNIELPNVTAEIGLLIGSNVPDAFAPYEVISGPSGSPHATKTRIGWIVWNILREIHAEARDVNKVTIEQYCECDMKLEELVKTSINYDFPERAIEEKREHSVEDKSFLKQVGESLSHENGHYSIGLPFRDNSVNLPNNMIQGQQRLESLKKKMMKNHQFRSDYIKFMNKLFESDFAEPVPEMQLQRDDGRVWYLPHHAVYHAKKPGKIRVVFDCSATFMGVSLNSQLLQGPDLTNSLLGVLIRFRQERIAVQGDIEAMFHQVIVPEKDRDCLRFLWWKDGNMDVEPKHYRMKVHIFGATSSPTCCNYALQRTAEEYGNDYDPGVSAAIMRNMYVDDCLSSVDTEEKARSLIRNLTTLCKQGGFHLTKWLSNSAEVLKSVPEENRAKDIKKLSLNDETLIERALGVYWFVEDDSLGFQIHLKDQPKTRRGILSVVSSIYDPLGIVAPFVMTAKTLLQELCKDGIGWDEEIDGIRLQNWNNWLAQVKYLENVKIERCYKPENFGCILSYQLHCFADASMLGMGIVIYLRISDSLGKVHCSFVMGKSRVAPLKTLTIPRMELTAATLAVKLSKLVDDQLEFPIEKIHFWTDSMSVLRYIANTKMRFQTFVANRLAIIHTYTTLDQWHYVNTKENPADCASRGVSVVSKFMDYQPWLKGPQFLWKPENSWNMKCDIEADNDLLENDVEVKKCVNTVLMCSPSEGIDRVLEYFSDWKRLKTTVGWLLKAKDNLRKIVKQKREIREKMMTSGISREKILQMENMDRKVRVKEIKNPREIPNLNSDTLKRAEEALVAYVQRQHYANELKDLSAENGHVKRSSQLSRLDPIIHDGILKVGGRLEKLDVPFVSKHQMIIPKNSVLARMIAVDAHRSTGHLGKNSTLAVIREKFWIPGVSSLLKSLMSKCVICRRYQSFPLQQKMANLPPERLEIDDPPFTRVGMDYFGPFELKRGRSVVKRYGVIFTCLNTRAVHLEVSYSLDTDSCIDAVRRFIARRGKPKFIRSDNGTNLVGAERELREAINKWNVSHIQTHLLQSGIDWTFNPPAASHFGGVWERLIRSVRKVLFSVLHEQTIHLDDEGLGTLFCEVEAILNGRPLTPASDDPSDLSVLTPNHLLLLRHGETCPPGTFLQTDNYVRRRWRQIQYLADVFWSRWMKQYLPLLQSRQKWLKRERNVKEGDLVLIVENGPRNSWNLGRVLDVQMDRHNIVRVVKVKTVSSILTRPITKLCLLLESDIKN